MQHNNTPEGELSYFETALLLHLRESHPHMAGNPDFIRSRADEAANVYEHSIRDGLTVTQALEQSDAVLYRDLQFSKFDTLLKWCRNGSWKCPLKSGRVSAWDYCRPQKPYSTNIP